MWGGREGGEEVNRRRRGGWRRDVEAPARIRARERGREWNEIIGGQGSEVEDGGKKRGLSHTFPLFLTSKIPPVRRNYSPPLKRTALLRCCFIPRSPLPPWQLFLIPSEVNGLGNEAFRGSPIMHFLLCVPFAAKSAVSTFSLTVVIGSSFSLPHSEHIIF